jgi:hypothetical protein
MCFFFEVHGMWVKYACRYLHVRVDPLELRFLDPLYEMFVRHVRLMVSEACVFYSAPARIYMWFVPYV